MFIVKTTDDISGYIQKQKANKLLVGFVPTMGALHKGHLSLIAASKNKNDITVCSVFINPTQFNNADDLKHYPVAIERDIEQLISEGCDLLFLPTLEQVYPPGYQPRAYDLGTIENVLEGKYRPGHFQGVCQVVDRLISVLQPDALYLGQKDFQQCAVIKKLMALLDKQEDITVDVCPTVREEDGLAMSSRNLRLTAEQRKSATTIFRVLNYIKENINVHSLERLIADATNTLEQNNFVVDYVEIADPETLQSMNELRRPFVILIAATIGNIRLIDNLLVN